MADCLQITDVGRVRILTLNRPARRNALTSELGWALVDSVREAARDDSVWVIGITGSGTAFCSGLDLAGEGEVSSLSPMDRQLDDLLWISRFPLVMRLECDKPVVAGINGVTVGGGLALAMATDVRIMKRSATIHPGYARIGASPDGGLTFTLPQAIGSERAMRLLLEGRMIDSGEAERIGLVGEVVDDENFDERFLSYCESLTSPSPIAARLTKRGVMSSLLGTDMTSQLRLEISNIGRAFASRDAKEARQAFLERRPPHLEGR